VAAAPQPKSTAPVRSAPPVHGFSPVYSRAIDTFTTPTRQIFQNADGTLTEQLTSTPSRFKAPDGTWRTIDLTAVADQDGSVHARSAQVSARVTTVAGLPAVTLPTSAGAITVAHTAASVGAAGAAAEALSAGPPAPTAAASATLQGGNATLTTATGLGVTYQLLRNGAEDLITVPTAALGSSYPATVALPAGITAKQAGASEIDFVDAGGATVASYVR